VLRRNGVAARVVPKLAEVDPHSHDSDRRSGVVERIAAGQVELVVNTPHGATSGGSPRLDGYEIRTAAVRHNVPCVTTVQGLAAAVQGIEAMRAGRVEVRSLQEWSAQVRR
jgi:carbamoyl-phosphate synthase large subunit